MNKCLSTHVPHILELENAYVDIDILVNDRLEFLSIANWSIVLSIELNSIQLGGEI